MYNTTLLSFYYCSIYIVEIGVGGMGVSFQLSISIVPTQLFMKIIIKTDIKIQLLIKNRVL